MKVFVETGSKRVFAGAIDWPGLARAAKTADEALAALVTYVPRYAKGLGNAAKAIKAPYGVDALDVVARLEGGSGTDFGVPSSIADFDRVPVTAKQLKRLIELLRASWDAFDEAAVAGKGRALAKGPRGGGRSLADIRAHVAEADGGYIASLGAKPPRGADWPVLQEAFVEALGAKVRGELPERGPRGGERWPARYAIRRSAWHALDHAWEIEDRLTRGQ